MAEVILLRHQLLVVTRGKKKCPPLTTFDRVVMALCAFKMTKYSKLFSKKTVSKPGPKGPSKELISLVIETKERNPSYGCPRIALLVSNVLKISLDEETVRRILKKYYKPLPGKGPSWLLPIGNSSNKLWSVDLFRLESVFLKSYWVMVVMDQFTRKIIGFEISRGAPDGAAVCFRFNKIAKGKTWPKFLSSDNDPLFTYTLWRANLEHHYGIEEIKTVPGCPWSHPFVERLIGSTRREFTDRILFWTEHDLIAKLQLYQEYFNSYRVHYAHTGKTPGEIDGMRKLATIDLKNYQWESVCGGLYQTPIAA
ncbi:MAG: integrase core domain-containing protein [Proteobacteria bacterium]|nr:integrase core domain-containing protein [Pseudomonadota bacterium]